MDIRVPRHKYQYQKVLLISLIASLLTNLILPTSTLAWKPTTHVYLADIALADALDDGHVTINRVDYQQGKVIGVIGEYAVDPDILAALQSHRAQYHAGLLGPDAYPDIVTGQMVIHPDMTETGINGGPDAWLSYLWEQSQVSPYDTPAVKAFTVGFLTHAAGDMYAHTFVNYFTGAPFTLFPPEGPENAIKHNVLEGYIDKRLPQNALDTDFFQASIAEVEDDGHDFIYRHMIDARPGTILDAELLKRDGGGTDYSVPRIYSTLRAELQEDIEGYDCEWYELDCLIEEAYKKAWRDDIDNGLRKWPAVSHQVAIALLFNEDRETKIQEATDILQDYVKEELLSMSGIPDAGEEIIDIIEEITPDFLEEIIEELKEDLINTLLQEAIGMTKDDLKEFLTGPDLWFDVVMNSGPGENITLKRFNSEYLGLVDPAYKDPNEAFDYHDVPAAYNTVTISKLVLLNQAEVNKLLTDLGSNVRLTEPNIMLGFVRTLDGDNQWLNGMVLAQDRQVYEQIFMRQAGEISGYVTPGGSGVYLPLVMTSPASNSCFEQSATIVGTVDDDTITGTSGDDVIVGKGGNDIIEGGEGNDLICGDEGDDTISGNAGNDLINGNMGNDIVRGGKDNDVLRGGQDSDKLLGDLGDDKLYGGLGDDELEGNEGRNLIFGGDGVDRCVADSATFDCED